MLRAIAAALVVWTHAELLLEQMNPARATFLRVYSDLGAFGVDIFFVISGAIMVLTSGTQFGQPGAGRLFIKQRATRVYPPYWFYATATLTLIILSGRLPDLEYLLRSYLLLPVLNAKGNLRPVLGVGWTLSYELYFYALFSVCLALPRARALPMLVISLIGIATLARLCVDPASAWGTFLSDFIVLEFAAGAAIGSLATRALARLPRLLSFGIAVLGVSLFLGAPAVTAGTRWLYWGAPATLIVTGVLSLEASGVRYWPKFLVTLGDSSYSMYLLHPVLFTVLRVLQSRTNWTAYAPVDACVAGCVALAIALSYPSYRIIELPLTRWMRKIFNLGRLGTLSPHAAQ